MLNDDIGSALALNRLAVVFFKRKKYDLSYMYHGKHAQQADDNDKFVAVYNAGISSRLLGEFHRATVEFQEALDISVPRNVSFPTGAAADGLTSAVPISDAAVSLARDESPEMIA